MANEKFFGLSQIAVQFSDTGNVGNSIILSTAGKRYFLLKLEGSADFAGDLDYDSGVKTATGAGDTIASGSATSNIGAGNADSNQGAGTADSNQGAGTAEQHGSIADTVTGADSATVCIASAATWIADTVSVGDLVTNSTDGSTATVITVDLETQVTTTALTGGSDDTYQSGDTLAITVGGVVLIDTSETFVTDLVAIGDTVLNVTDSSSAVVTALTETTLTMAAGLTGGTDDLWENGDTFTIHSATIINDSSETFVTDLVAIGDTVLNTTDSSVGVITSLTETSLTCSAGFSGGTNNYTVDTNAFTAHSATIINDSGETFATDGVAIGDKVENTSDVSTGIVTALTETSLTCGAGFSGGTNDYTTNTDAFTVQSTTIITDSSGAHIAEKVYAGTVLTNTTTAETATVVSVDSATQITTTAITGFYTSGDNYTIEDNFNWTQVGGKTISSAVITASGGLMLNEDLLLPTADGFRVTLTGGGRISLTYKIT